MIPADRETDFLVSYGPDVRFAEVHLHLTVDKPAGKRYASGEDLLEKALS
jgi:hypothetical protein